MELYPYRVQILLISKVFKMKNYYSCLFQNTTDLF
nr:MAG TPA: hypothetical protein [Caudoviricetes sp.]